MSETKTPRTDAVPQWVTTWPEWFGLLARDLAAALKAKEYLEGNLHQANEDANEYQRRAEAAEQAKEEAERRIKQLENGYDTLRTALHKAERDAARYRWLRIAMLKVPLDWNLYCALRDVDADKVDAAVDAALAKQDAARAKGKP